MTAGCHCEDKRSELRQLLQFSLFDGTAGGLCHPQLASGYWQVIKKGVAR